MIVDRVLPSKLLSNMAAGGPAGRRPFQEHDSRTGARGRMQSGDRSGSAERAGNEYPIERVWKWPVAHLDDTGTTGSRLTLRSTSTAGQYSAARRLSWQTSQEASNPVGHEGLVATLPASSKTAARGIPHDPRVIRVFVLAC
jgi:hypothetical protein